MRTWVKHLLEAVAEPVLWGWDAQRASLVALEALPAAGRAPARAWQRACLVGLQNTPLTTPCTALALQRARPQWSAGAFPTDPLCR